MRDVFWEWADPSLPWHTTNIQLALHPQKLHVKRGSNLYSSPATKRTGDWRVIFACSGSFFTELEIDPSFPGNTQAFWSRLNRGWTYRRKSVREYSFSLHFVLRADRYERFEKHLHCTRRQIISESKGRNVAPLQCHKQQTFANWSVSLPSCSVTFQTTLCLRADL